MATMADLRAGVEESGGVKTFSMWKVRDAYGAGRLGIHVRTNISKALLGMGLGHFPNALPDSQDALIRLYKLGSPVADLVEAVLHPGPEADERLRDAVAGNAEGVLAQVRELVCA